MDIWASLSLTTMGLVPMGVGALAGLLANWFVAHPPAGYAHYSCCECWRCPDVRLMLWSCLLSVLALAVCASAASVARGLHRINAVDATARALGQPHRRRLCARVATTASGRVMLYAHAFRQ